MWVKHVTLHNFGPFPHFETPLVRGLVGIMGRNGGGKSTVADGVYATFSNDFGRFKGVKVDNIYDQIGPREESFTEIVAEHEGTEFTLRRSLKPNRSTLTLPGEKEITNAYDIEARLCRDLGVDMKLIDAYVFVSNWQLRAFLAATPGERAEAFKHLCRTQQADLIYAAINRMLERDAPMEVLDNSDDLLAQVGEADASLASYETEKAKWEVQQLNTKSKASAEELVQKRRRYTELSAELGTSQAREVVLRKALLESQDELTTLETAELQAKQLCEKRKEPSIQAQAALRTWAQHERRVARKQQLETEIQALKQALAAAKPPQKPAGFDEYVDLLDERANLELKMREAQEVIAAFEESNGSGACPTCHQAIDENFVEEQRQLVTTNLKRLPVVKATITACEAYNAATRALEKQSEANRAKQEALSEELQSIQALQEPSGDKASLEKDLRLFREAEDNFHQAQAVSRAKQRAVQMWTAELGALEKAIRELSMKIAQNQVSDELHSKAVRRLNEDRVASLEVSRLNGQIHQVQVNRATAQASLDRLRALMQRQDKLRKAFKLLREVRDVFHWNCLPHQVAHGNLVLMENDLNKALEWFGEPFMAEAITAKEDEQAELGFLVHFPGAPPRKAERLSTGQQGVFAVAFRRAISQIFDADIGTMWLDEPTANWDEGNVSYFGEALERLAAEVRGQRQLVIITHALSLQESFDQVVEVA